MGSVSKDVSRRGFVKGASLASLAALATAGTTAMFGCTPRSMSETGTDEPQNAVALPDRENLPNEEVIWHRCASCGSTCPLQFHVSDGTIQWVECDTTGDKDFGGIEFRSCLRGRSIRRWINHPDRLKKPLKRVEGTKRGEGQYEEIEWDEAIDLFYEKLKYTLDTYGNEAVMRCTSLGTEDNATVGSWFDRLMNLLGGQLGTYGTDSQTQLDFAASNRLFSSFITQPGGFLSNISWMGSPAPVALDADLVVLFGSSAATSRLQGAMSMYDWAQMREKGTRIVCIDVRMGEEESAHPDEWMPIRPGTDGALASAINYVLITEGFADEDQIRSCCTGYDEETLPESAKGQHASYKDYLLGTGYDMVAKTPEWASPITRIPVDDIYQLARDIGNAERCFIAQGLGVQRRANGELNSASIMMIPFISGHWGLPGTSTGLKTAPSGGPACNEYTVNSGVLPLGENPVKASIPVTKRIEVIERGHEFTALRDGVHNVDKLNADVKFVYAYMTACLTNQTPDVNWSAKVLEDESKAEFIVGSDFFLTNSMMYCDLILPDVMPQETYQLAAVTSSGRNIASVFGRPVQERPFDVRSEWDWMVDLADRFGLKDAFTEGYEYEQIVRANYDALVASSTFPTLPATFDEGLELGLWHTEATPEPSLAAFRADPAANPLNTPSGKMEIYCEGLAQAAATWEFDDEYDFISPIPMYAPGFNSYEDCTEEYPLLGSTWKSKIRFQSKFNQIDVLNQACRHVVWINPLDAETRGIQTGDMVRIFNDVGEIHIEARVTPRMVPGAFALENGRMRKLDENGVDVGGCANTLVPHHWAPLSKFNCNNSIIAQIAKL